MRFAIIAASLVAAVAAQYPVAGESCAAPVTVTVTKTMPIGHTPVAPTSGSSYYATSAVYPTGTAAVPDASTVSSVKPPVGTGTAAPSGTSPPYTQFTGAASGLKVGSALAGVGAVAALLL